MTTDDAEEGVTGTVLRASDGSVFFVPTDDLQAYRLEGDDAERAIDAVDDEVSGFSFSPKTDMGAGFNLKAAPVEVNRLRIGDTTGGGSKYQYQKFTTG